MKQEKQRDRRSSTRDDRLWEFDLYVTGTGGKAATAFKNLKTVCDERLPGRFNIHVIDLLKYPRLALHNQIVAIPTTVKRMPPPVSRVIGDLSNIQLLLDRMGLKPSLPLPARTSKQTNSPSPGKG